MLEAAGPRRLRDFALNQPDVLELLQLEHDVSAVLEHEGRRFTLEGQIDRLDRREQGLVILDYKSGNTSRQPRLSFWEDEHLWSAMYGWRPGLPDPLAELADTLPSIQLPCYLYMCGNDPRNAETLRTSPWRMPRSYSLPTGGKRFPCSAPASMRRRGNISSGNRSRPCSVSSCATWPRPRSFRAAVPTVAHAAPTAKAAAESACIPRDTSITRRCSGRRRALPLRLFSCFKPQRNVR